MKLLDTIAAISTPRGKGGVAMIRISGADALAVGDRIFRRINGSPLSSAKPSLLCRGNIVEPLEENTVIDDGMAAIFCAPKSFTGEDCVEIYCHGGVLVTERVLTAALLAGARAAEAGEFTRRAFICGKLSLSEAEALGALLEAKSFSQMKLARAGMSGKLSAKTQKIYADLLSLMSGIYAAIDYPDEDLNEYSRTEICDAVSTACGELEALIKTYRTGHAVSEGIKTVICGRANAGKSSLYNAIVGTDAAIVTDIEGTTRDVLKQTATLGSTTLLLCDTAGIRKTDDRVESMGIERALRELDDAELVLAVFDASAPLCEDDTSLAERLCNLGKTCIALLNKSDLSENSETASFISSRFEHTLKICASGGEGMDVLARTVDEMFIDGSIDMDNDAVVMYARQHASLQNALRILSDALDELKADAPLDLACIGIEEAMSAIGSLDGREVGEEIVAQIFSKFCVGK